MRSVTSSTRGCAEDSGVPMFTLRSIIVEHGLMLIALAAVLASCGGAESAGDSSRSVDIDAPVASSEVTIGGPHEGMCDCDDTSIGVPSIIRDGAFEGDLDIPVGQTVTWVNDDATTHVVSAEDGSFTSDELAPDTSHSRKFEAAGAWGVYCELHPEMTMTVTVG